MATRRYVVRGRVQAVGFREFTRRTASALGVVGWVRNLADGRSVEAVASGEPGALETFEAALRRGPGGAFVSELVAEEHPPIEATRFDVRR